MERHPWVGMVNSGGCSHIIAALQLLFNIQEVRKFVIDDAQHRKNCRSLLCSTCALYNVFLNLQEGKCVAPVFFITKWKSISGRLPEDKRQDVHECVFLLLTGLRQEHLMTSKNTRHYTLSEVNKTMTSTLFGGKQSLEVVCAACNSIDLSQEFLSVEINNLGNKNLSHEIRQELWKEELRVCHVCNRTQAKWKVLQVEMPKYLIVRASNCRVAAADLQDVRVGNDCFHVKSCVVQNYLGSSDATATCVCPDGFYREFHDSQVRKVNASTFLTSTFPENCTLTLIFLKKSSTVSSSTQLKSQVVQPGLIKIREVHTSQTAAWNSPCGGSEDAPDCKTPDTNPICEGKAATKTSSSAKDVAVQTGPYADYAICKLDMKIKFFTGLSVEDHSALFNLIGGDKVLSKLKLKYKGSPKKYRPSKLSNENKLHLFLLRFRRGLPLEELAHIFSVSVSTAGEWCYVMTRIIYLTFKAMEDDFFVSAQHQRKDKPSVMRPFKNLRVILDGASFYHQKPTNFEMQGNSFSSYKHMNVTLVSVGIACNGATIYCSRGMEGAMSDKQVVLQSGLLQKLRKGDGVMTDRGYELTAELQAIGCEFYKPPVLGDRPCFTAEEEILTKAIAAARIYSEHAIADMKDNRLLQGVIPLTLCPVIPQLIYIAAFLRNFYPSRIRDKKFVVQAKKRTAADGNEVCDSDDE